MAEYYGWAPVASTNSLRAWTEKWVYEQPDDFPTVYIKLFCGKWFVGAQWTTSTCTVNDVELEGAKTRESAQEMALALVARMMKNC